MPMSVPSGILIHPTVLPQYTNITDTQTGQTDRQWSDSIGRFTNGRPTNGQKQLILASTDYMSRH